MNNDEKCKKCGRCCYRKMIINNVIVFTNSYCKYYNPDTKLCKDYNNRFNLGVSCLCIDEAIKNKALPSDCPYVEEIENYIGPISYDEFIKKNGND